MPLPRIIEKGDYPQIYIHFIFVTLLTALRRGPLSFGRQNNNATAFLSYNIASLT
jgi:hypothetical protein